ncbi:MAG: tRNA glutamyl-Q(34) synthetase GluQRS [Solirubrobacterales bacterium]|nr:tRNA glutamyl-Q(34) synthetase GluQRS [Solirubrobacterales bacterium]
MKPDTPSVTATGTGPGRYAPSPTGELHLGNLRTALIAWLAARSRGAEFLMRIEDLDRGRSREEWISTQLKELETLGIDWDGELVRQSERDGLYADAVRQLEAAGLTYECFCTRAEIREASSAPHGDLPEGAYPGICQSLTEAEIAERRASGRPPALRVRADAASITFQDLVCGETTGIVDDFVIRRNDGDHAYNLAVTVDDSEQGIDEVVRGADLLDSTPRQLWLYDRLDLRSPRVWAHVPLMLGGDGARLAKRHGAVTLEERLVTGDSVEVVTGELAATAGLVEPGRKIAAHDLISGFDWSKL